MMKEMSPEEKVFPEEVIAEMVDYVMNREHAARDADAETVQAAYERGYWDGVKSIVDGKIEVGDEVKYKTGEIGVVVRIGVCKGDREDIYQCVRYDGDVSITDPGEKPMKTGRHFPQIVEVLKQMRDNQEG